MDSQTSWLTGKTTLVTGAAKRIGRATALALAGRGVNVVIHYRSSENEAESVANEVRGTGAKAWIIKADLHEPSEAESLLSYAVEAAGQIQILINNASIFTKSRITDFTVEELADNVQVNAMTRRII